MRQNVFSKENQRIKEPFAILDFDFYWKFTLWSEFRMKQPQNKISNFPGFGVKSNFGWILGSGRWDSAHINKSLVSYLRKKYNCATEHNPTQKIKFRQKSLERVWIPIFILGKCIVLTCLEKQLIRVT